MSFSQLSFNKGKLTEVKEAIKEQRKAIKALRDEQAQEKNANAKAGLDKKATHAEKKLSKLQDEVGAAAGWRCFSRLARSAFAVGAAAFMSGNLLAFFFFFLFAGEDPQRSCAQGGR